MITAIGLENFKAFGEKVTFPCAPITLIFGENSAGKSSILKALYLLKQTVEGESTQPTLLFRTNSGLVDFGSFAETVFRHNTKKPIVLRIDVNISKSELSSIVYGSSSGIEYSFQQNREQNVLINEIKLFDGENSCLAEFKAEQTEQTMTPLYKCKSATISERYWKSIFERRIDLLYHHQPAHIASHMGDVMKYLEALSYETFINQIEALSAEMTMEMQGILPRNIVGYDDFYDELFTDQNPVSDDVLYSHYIDDIYRQAGFRGYMEFIFKNKLRQRLGEPLLPEPSIPDDDLSDKERQKIKEKIAFSNANFAAEKANKKQFLSMSRVANILGNLIKSGMQSLTPLAPLRSLPKRHISIPNTSPDDIGYSGDYMPEMLYRNHNLLKRTDRWLELLGTDYNLKIKKIGQREDEIFSVKLRDNKLKADVNITDVGFGMSQLLPIIVQSVINSNKIIAIEQPELHLHPRMQAEIAELFTESFRENNNQFLIETHSEHLILRIQRLVRQKKLSPDDVSVLYVSREKNGSKVSRMRLNEEGEFMDDWPGGFFPERLNELMD